MHVIYIESLMGRECESTERVIKGNKKLLLIICRLTILHNTYRLFERHMAKYEIFSK